MPCVLQLAAMSLTDDYDLVPTSAQIAELDSNITYFNFV